VRAKTQTNKDLVTLREIDLLKKKTEESTHVFKEGDNCQRPNNGTNSSNDIFLRRYGARCGPDSIEDIQRRGANIGVNNA
jgi:hypothetical protein